VGIGKEVFQSLGGGEAFIRSERNNGTWRRFVSRIYWDTMLFVYLIEAHPKHGSAPKEMSRDDGTAPGYPLYERLHGSAKSSRDLTNGAHPIWLCESGKWSAARWELLPFNH